MADKFMDAAGRVHNVKPFPNARKTDSRNVAHYGGIGIRQGYHVTVTAPASVKVTLTKGVALDPLGKEVLVAPDKSLSAAEFQKALNASFYLYDVRANVGTTVYDAIDPAAHAILLTLDATREVVKAHKITVAEVALVAAGVVDLTSVTAGLAYFEAATVDHVARGRVSTKNPDNLDGANTKVATEYIIAVCAKDIAGAAGVVGTVTMYREKDVWVDFSGLP